MKALKQERGAFVKVVYVRVPRLRRVRYIVRLSRRGVVYVNLCGDAGGIGLIVP